MNNHDQNASAGNGDSERVVVRDRRRIDPVTGEVRVPAGDQPAGTGLGGSETAPAAPGTEDLLAADELRVVELTAQVQERTADLQRITAEYANYRRRVDRDRDAVLASARVQFVGELLTVLDDLDRADAHDDLTGPFKAVADKIAMVVGKLGLESFGDAGELFEPAVHEAVQHESTDIPGPTATVVSSVLRRGYRLGDRVLRPAMVTVADRPADVLDGDIPGEPGEPA